MQKTVKLAFSVLQKNVSQMHNSHSTPTLQISIDNVFYGIQSSDPMFLPILPKLCR